MPRNKLNQKTVDRMRAPNPSGKDIIHFDINNPGFGVFVSGKTTRKAYVVQTDAVGRRVIAKTTERTFEEAKQEALELLPQMRKGIDPRPKRDISSSTATLAATLDLYLLSRNDLSERSRQDYPK